MPFATRQGIRVGDSDQTAGRAVHLMHCGGLAGAGCPGHDRPARLAREGNLRHQKENDSQWETTTARAQESDHPKSDANCGDETLKVPILMDDDVERRLAVIRCLLGP